MRLFEPIELETEDTRCGRWQWPVAVGLWNVIAVAGLVAVVSRAFGGEPVGDYELRLIGLVAFVASVVARELTVRSRTTALPTWSFDAVSTALPLPFVLSIASSRAESAAWLLVAVLALVLGRRSDEWAEETDASTTVKSGTIESASEEFAEATFEHLLVVPHSFAEEPPEGKAESDDVVDEWSRRRTAEGESVAGHCSVSFDPGARIVAVHVPFVPPFAQPPEFDFEVAGEMDVSAKVTQLRTYGVRLEVRRSGALDDAGTCRVEWVAHRPAVDNAA